MTEPTKSGTVKRIAESTKYAMTATFTGVGLGLVGEAAVRGDTAGAVSVLWPVAVVTAAYVLGQGLVDASEKNRKP